MIDKITSKTNKRVQYAFSLKDKKTQLENNAFLFEGIKSLNMALESGNCLEIFSLKEIKNVDENIPLHIVNESIIDKLAFSKNPEGIVFIAKIPSFDKKINKAIYLDDISDPGNIGTIIRSALAFNFDAIFISKDCVSPYNFKSLASSKGAIFKIPVIIKDLKQLKNDYQLIGTAIDKSALDIKDIKPKDKFILVFGNEAHGIRKEYLDICDLKSFIPINNIDSLNVAICSSIYMHHFYKK